MTGGKGLCRKGYIRSLRKIGLPVGCPFVGQNCTSSLIFVMIMIGLLMHIRTSEY